jgi:hypothetical protein
MNCPYCKTISVHHAKWCTYSGLKEQKPMTREEAVKKLNDKIGNHYNPTTILNVLEALGLLKFEKEDMVMTSVGPINADLYAKHHTAINEIINKGYKIVRNQS